jgi:hypothetical protein
MGLGQATCSTRCRGWPVNDSSLIRFSHPAYQILPPQHSTSRPSMHFAWCIHLFLLGLADVVSALRSGKWCPRACELTLNYATFNDTDLWLSRKVRQCRSDLRIVSLYLCFDEFCSLEDGRVSEYIADSSEWCDEHAGVTLPPFRQTVDGWTPEDRAQVPRLSAAQAVTWPVLNTTVLPEHGFLERAFTTLVGNAMFIDPQLLTQSRMLPSMSMMSTLSTDGTCTTSGSLS